MQKIKDKIIANHVGALSVRNTHEKDPIAPSKNHRGITLIALIITIIVMIILVAVTVNVALNGGLFETTKQAAENTVEERDKELELSTGAIIDEWVNGENTTLPEGWSVAEKPAEWNNDKVIAVTDGTNIIPLPQGYEISKEDGENTIEEGVVIKDSKENEFVWIPVAEDFTSTYSREYNYSEPIELPSKVIDEELFDSQATLDYLYGEGYFDYPGTEEEKANVENSFAYKAHYEEMVASVNKYNGFYVGRYETTIDENNEIGSIYNKKVLTANNILKEGINPNINSNNNLYYYRWWGLYYTERNSNVIGSKDYIQTNMIWGQQWDAIIDYFDSRSIDYSEFGINIQGAVVNSGQSTNSSNEKDEIYNIYDLRTNCLDCTAEAYSTNVRVWRGGSYNNNASAPYSSYSYPSSFDNNLSSRLTLYIK